MTDASGAAAALTVPTFCEDAALGYRRSLTDFSNPLSLDDSYRLAHLPLALPPVVTDTAPLRISESPK